MTGVGERVRSAPQPEATTPTNRHFRHLVAVWVSVPARPRDRDPLGFDVERWHQGEADVLAGRIRAFDDVINGLRARVRRDRD